MLSATVMFGNSAYDWKTIPTLRWFGGLRVMSTPSIVIVPAVGMLEAGDHPQGRRLAAAGRPEERDELAALGGQVEVLHRDDVAEALLDAAQLEEGHRTGASMVSGRRRSVTLLREPRPTNEIAIIASQVRPKLMSETAAGS